MARTWMPRCDGAIILSDIDDERIPSIKVRQVNWWLPHEADGEGANANLSLK